MNLILYSLSRFISQVVSNRNIRKHNKNSSGKVRRIYVVVVRCKAVKVKHS